MDMSDRYRLRDDNSPDMEKGMHWPIYHIFQHWIKITKLTSKGKLTVGRKWRHGPHERLDIVLSEIFPDGLISRWHFRCLRMGKIDVITYKYVIIYIYCMLVRKIWKFIHPRVSCCPRGIWYS
jgi:hypothetical protein